MKATLTLIIDVEYPLHQHDIIDDLTIGEHTIKNYNNPNSEDAIKLKGLISSAITTEHKSDFTQAMVTSMKVEDIK